MDEENIWDKHRDFSKAVNEINHFAQSSHLDEDEVDYLQGDFEDGLYESVFERLEDMKSEIIPLYKAVNIAYDYIKNLKENQ